MNTKQEDLKKIVTDLLNLKKKNEEKINDLRIELELKQQYIDETKDILSNAMNIINEYESVLIEEIEKYKSSKERYDQLVTDLKKDFKLLQREKRNFLNELYGDSK